MAQISKQSPARQGAWHGAVYVPILAPFSMLFGIFAADLQLSFWQTLGFSVGIFAGASQFASLSLLSENAPIFIAVLAGFTLNLRFLLYSASLSPHFIGLPLIRRVLISAQIVDQNYVLSETHFPEHPEWNALDRFHYFMGIAIVVALPWHFFTLLGFFTRTALPAELDISFALPLSFIALIIPALKTPAHWLAALISILGTLMLRFLPYNLGLLVSAGLAILAAGQFEAWQEKRNP